MEGLIPYGVGVVLIVASLTILAMALVVLVTFFWWEYVKAK